MRIISILTVLIPLVFSPVFANSTSRALWKKATKAYTSGNKNKAVSSLEILTQKHWGTPEGPKAAALLIELNLQRNNTSEAYRLSNRFLESFPKSEYRDRVEIALAQIRVLHGDLLGGMEDLIRVMSWSTNPLMQKKARHIALKVLSSSLLSTGEMISLLDQNPREDDVVSWLLMQLGRQFQTEGRYKSARYYYSQVVLRYPATPQSEVARKGMEMLVERGDGPPVILVLAPLSGDFADFGIEMVQGVSLAQSLYSDSTKEEINLRIVDDRADPVTAVRKLRTLMKQEPVIGVIGPVMSQGATAVGAWLAKTYPKIPLITPTATDEGIADLGRNIFQINVSTAVQARNIATHAARCLDYREFAVLAPLTEYGRIMAEEFSRTVESAGGSVQALQYYEEGSPDYKTEFNIIRDRRWNIQNRRHNMIRGIRNIDQEEKKFRARWLEDSTAVFDAIFIPASDPSDAATMAAHTRFNKISGTILGSSGWYGKALLRSGKHEIEKAVFSVPFAENSDAPEFRRFQKAFENKFNQAKPSTDKVSGLSYDATRMLLVAWKKANGGNVAHYLLTSPTFQGVYGSIRFSDRGANISTEILTVNKGRFATVETCQ